MLILAKHNQIAITDAEPGNFLVSLLGRFSRDRRKSRAHQGQAGGQYPPPWSATRSVSRAAIRSRGGASVQSSGEALGRCTDTEHARACSMDRQVDCTRGFRTCSIMADLTKGKTGSRDGPDEPVTCCQPTQLAAMRRWDCLLTAYAAVGRRTKLLPVEGNAEGAGEAGERLPRQTGSAAMP